MSRSSILIILGVLTMLAPFSGLPIAVRTVLTVIFGACVLGIGVMLRAREARVPHPPAETPPPPGISPI